jgi:DNA-binding NarL/FixJ family response regulator
LVCGGMVSVIVEQIGVVLADDDVFARRGLRAVIEADPALAVVGEASNCAEALSLAGAGGVHVILVKPGSGLQGCLQLMEELRRRAIHVPIIVIGPSERDDDVLRLVQAGAAGYLDRTASPDELVDAVRTVAEGGHALDPQALTMVLRDYEAQCDRVSGRNAHTLTPRERQVLTLVAEGRSTCQIAAELLLSKKTIEVHRRNIMNKLDMHKVADLVRYAIREGLVDLDEP